MSKIIANNVSIAYLPNNKTAITFMTDNRYTASRFVQELDYDKIEVTAKQYKSNRTLRQNDYMWKLIQMMSDKLNGEHTEDSMLKIYGELLTQANVKRDLIAVLPQAVETLKSTFRAVVKTGQTIKSVNAESGKTAELVSVWVYHGSSKFNTKEMGELLDIAIMKCSELGIQDSELLSIENEYKGVK
jgi:hypothetical protein